MAMLHRIGSPLSAENRVKLNENWDIIEQLLTSFRQQLQFVSGVENIEEVIDYLNDTMDNVNDLRTRFDEALGVLIKERDDLLKRSEESLTGHIDTLSNIAMEQLQAEIDALQSEVVETIATLQENIDRGEQLQGETTELIDQLTAGITEMESRTQSALDNMESRVAETLGRMNTATDEANAERERLESIRFMGDYDADTTYMPGNMIAFAGSSYIALLETTGVEPVPYESSDTWRLMARRGMDGLGTVSYVNGVGADEEGRVTIGKETIGLDNVDNTADAEKPLSTPQREILDEMSTNLSLMGATGDGSDARQIFLDALAEKNETILVPKGIYTMKEIVLRRNVRIIGTGWDSVLRLPTDLTTAIRGAVDGVDGMKNAMFGIAEPIHVTFENLTFDGDFFNQPEKYNGGCFLRIFKPSVDSDNKITVTFKNCNFINNNHTAIAGYGSGRTDSIFINVHDCYFAGGAKGTTQTSIAGWSQGYAPHFISTYDNITLTVIGNKFIDDILPDNVTTFGRVAINATVTDTSSVENSDKLATSMFIQNNVFKNLGRNASSPNGLGVIDMYVNGENVVVSGNKFINSQMQSVRGKVNVKNLIVANNVVQGGLDGGIAFHPNNYASKKGHAVVANNVVENTLGYGILFNGRSGTDPKPFFESVIISNNMIRNIGVVDYRDDLANGVFLSRVKNANVTGNEFTNILYDAISIEESEDITVCNNICHTRSEVDALGRGIYARLISGSAMIIGNKVSGNTNGIYLVFNTSATQRTAVVKGNHIKEVRNASGQALYIGEFLTGVAEGNIVDNVIPKTGVTVYGYNFKGTLLTLTGNVYYDGTSQSLAIKLKGNIGTLKESNNSWN